MKSKNFYKIIGIASTLLLFSGNIFGQQQRRPDTGFKAHNSYSVSDIENVNVTNGNLMLDIPLASLPAGRGTSPGYNVSLNYNSKLWNSKKEYRSDGIGSNLEDLYYTRELVESNDQGGWYLDSGSYRLNLVNRQAVEPQAACMEYIGENEYRRNGYIFKLELQLPNGGITEFHPYGTNGAYGEYPGYPNGFYSIDPHGVQHSYSYAPPGPFGGPPACSYSASQITTAGINYYTRDGSGLRLFLPYQPGQIFALMRWTLYFPDGRVLEYKPQDDPTITQRLTDLNGNKLLWKPATLNGYNGTKLRMK